MTRSEPFGTLPDGQPVERVRIAGGGLTAHVLTFGATVQDLRLDGIDRPLVLGADEIAPYLGPMRYFGAIVGRFANRIGNARFILDGRTYETDPNFRDRHTLHGGSAGAGDRIWQIADLERDAVRLRLRMADGEMGFPGNLDVHVRYRLAGDGALQVTIMAETDAPTPCSLAHHGYFNLDGGPDILGHRLQAAAEHYLPVDTDLIPTGEIAPVGRTAFDFRHPRPVAPGGYDHNLCLGRARGPLREVARLTGATGATMTVATTEPGLQVYDGAHIDTAQGLEGRAYGAHAGLALETQGWPDAPNRPEFPDTVLRPGDVYRSETVYRFSPAP
ncbi:aldose epimerase family protein [Chachezhania sediminis]|uniref:aldose epimerase family protein n=1 Tax=Chachezhania sediminis TaxID=2599291 RepID=UPI00131E64A3|nr:aldose epimerase family protein [Chachezhania sediminis]